MAFSLNGRLLRALNALAQGRQRSLQLAGDRAAMILNVFEGLIDVLIRRLLERFEAFRDARFCSKNWEQRSGRTDVAKCCRVSAVSKNK